MTEHGPLDLVLTLTKEDFADYLKVREEKQLTLTTKILFVLAVCFLSFLFYEAIRYSLVAAISLVAIVLVPYLALGSLSVLFRWRHLKRLVRQHGESLGPARHVIDQSGISVYWPGERVDFDWSSVRKVKEAKLMFLLCTNRDVDIVLPKRCFPSPEEISTFRKTVKTLCRGTLELQN